MLPTRMLFTIGGQVVVSEAHHCDVLDDVELEIDEESDVAAHPDVVAVP